MNGAELLETILRPWRAAVADAIDPAYFDGFIERNRDEIIVMLSEWLERRRQTRSAGPSSSLEAPPDEWTAAQRAKANLEAMQIIATRTPDQIDDPDRRALLRYSGWGGLSIEKYQEKFPAGWDPDAFGLIHEYYTPTRIARAVAGALCDFLPGLAGRDGKIRALEPSAGIGRMILALDQVSCPRPPLHWTAIELSTVAARMLPLLFPAADVHAMSFEEWLHRQTARPDRASEALPPSPREAGKVHLIVSNPPYGKRGVTAKFDQSPEYQEREAFAYFLRRGLDLLAPFGIGVFLIPAGFMTGRGDARSQLRDRVLRRHHLMSAFRLPSEIFPGANLVTDLLFFRARGGELAEVDEADRFIFDGRYFDEFPSHVLGKEEGRGDDDDELDRPRGRHFHRVLGDFRGLPPLIERPLCSACIVRPVAVAPAVASRLIQRADTGDLAPQLATATTLGHRATDYLAERAQGSARAVELWPELLQSIRDFQAAPEIKAAGNQNPWVWMELRSLAEAGNTGAQAFLNIFNKDGAISEALTTKPRIEERFTGDPNDALAQADFLYRSRRRITLDDLLTFHRARGGTLDRVGLRDRLFRGDWCADGPGLQQMVPLADYLTGDLWPKVQHLEDALSSAPIEPVQIARQRDRLYAAIQPQIFEDLGAVSPTDGYIPLPLLAQFISEEINLPFPAVTLERARGLVAVVGEDYSDLPIAMKTKSAEIGPETLLFLGWLNRDNSFFSPRDLHPADPLFEQMKQAKVTDDVDSWDRRASHERAWTVMFNDWLRADEERRRAVVDAYNHSIRGYVRRNFGGEPLTIARWSPAITLQPHQNAGARRVLEARGGLIAFDVGVGKTYTGLAILARARQEGWGRRPVVLVPKSILWKWYRDFERCLPDYRVAVIGSTRGKLTKGKRFKEASEALADGQINLAQFEQMISTARVDSREERAAKWSAFQAGLYDAVILSYTALDGTAVDMDSIVAYARSTPAIERITSLKERNEEKKGKSKSATERKKAIAAAGVEAFVMEKLEPREGKELDPGVRWEDLGIDLLIVDEAQNFKNLYAPEPRRGGMPKFMGLPQGGSNRAWQLDFRSSFVRQRTGGSGVVLLSATPAKNSPLEFYNLLQYVDHDAFVKVGIRHPEEFIDRYLKIEPRDVLNADFDIVKRDAVVGFQRLDELRDILDRYAEFRTAEEVGLKLPRARVQRVDVSMNADQERKYDVLVGAMTERLEALLKGESVSSTAILGDMVRLSLIALHPDLDEGYDWTTALEGGVARRSVEVQSVKRWTEDRGWSVVDRANNGNYVVQRELPAPETYSAPKLQAVAERIIAQPGCGHVVFVEPIACHRWLVEVLVEHGIPRERIAVMNATNTADAASRLRVADGFNGSPEEDPLFDVLIANSVAYEGVDLQTRTCAIHHLDLPWTPADLEQRNGRGYRQGNTLGTIEILYYIAQGSMDGYRFSVIHGKRGWLADLIASQAKDTNNPAAQQDFSPEELLEYIARDKNKIRGLLEQRREQKEAEARERRARAAGNILRQAAERFREARRLQDEPERAAKLLAEAEQRLKDLEGVDPEVWPWMKWAYALRSVDGLVTMDGTPVYEGLHATMPNESLEFGAYIETNVSMKVGVRSAGTAIWELMRPDQIEALGLRPEHLLAPWTEDELAVERSLDATIARLDSASSLRWAGASEKFRRTWWARRGAVITEALARRGQDKELLPVVVSKVLALKSGPALRDGQLLPPTAEGWARYLELAPLSGENFKALRDVGERWWSRKIPSSLLAALAPKDQESALVILRRQLDLAKGAQVGSPRDFVEWLDDQNLDDAAALLESYLDEATIPLDDLLRKLRDHIIEGLQTARDAETPGLNSRDAIGWNDALDIDRRVLLVGDDGRHYVLAYGPSEPTRRVFIDPGASLGAPATVSAGSLNKTDQIWEVGTQPDDAERIEEVWRRYARLARGLEFAPSFMHEARELLSRAAEAIESPLCVGAERKAAITALQLAKKYFDRARDRVLLGRPAQALAALQRLIERLSESAEAVGRACGAGQISLTPAVLTIRAADRQLLADQGDNIVDRGDTDITSVALQAIDGGAA
jgi:hypothetical protein